MKPNSDLPLEIPLYVEEGEESQLSYEEQQNKQQEESQVEEIEETRAPENLAETTGDISITIEQLEGAENQLEDSKVVDYGPEGPEFEVGGDMNDTTINTELEDAFEAGENLIPEEEEMMDGEGPLELGAVNDLQQQVDGAEVVEGGDDEGEPGQNWHPHTVKVFKLLQRQFQTKDVVSYNTIARGTKRRTAAGCFFELLQLKTWDYIELQQSEAFGDIKVTPARRFNEVEAV